MISVMKHNNGDGDRSGDCRASSVLTVMDVLMLGFLWNERHHLSFEIRFPISPKLPRVYINNIISSSNGSFGFLV